jgi:cell division protein FtsI/penicillin-binding protein 2
VQDRRIGTAALVLGGLLAWQVPALGGADLTQPPRVRLDQINLTETRAYAPVVGGGRAELTVKPELQRRAQQLLALAHPRSGAVVMLHARSAKVLVWAQIAAGDSGPLYRARAPAASVFKIVTAAALLEQTQVTPSLRVCTQGGEHDIERDHLEPPHEGRETCGRFGDALGHSRNAVFAQLATRYLARNDLLETAERLGFNASIPFDQPIPMGELVVPYNDLDFARTAAGFENSRLSPLGAAELAYIVASAGQTLQLRIVQSAPNYTARRLPRVVRRSLRAETARALRHMMEVTVNSGTSLDAFTDDEGRSFLGDIRVAGKTGTLRPSDRAATASWFIGFAPSKNPQIIVSVLLENGSTWRRKANEVARDLLRTYFAKRGAAGVTDPLDGQ